MSYGMTYLQQQFAPANSAPAGGVSSKEEKKKADKTAKANAERSKADAEAIKRETKQLAEASLRGMEGIQQDHQRVNQQSTKFSEEVAGGNQNVLSLVRDVVSTVGGDTAFSMKDFFKEGGVDLSEGEMQEVGSLFAGTDGMASAGMHPIQALGKMALSLSDATLGMTSSYEGEIRTNLSQAMSIENVAQQETKEASAISQVADGLLGQVLGKLPELQKLVGLFSKGKIFLKLNPWVAIALELAQKFIEQKLQEAAAKRSESKTKNSSASAKSRQAQEIRMGRVGELAKKRAEVVDTFKTAQAQLLALAKEMKEGVQTNQNERKAKLTSIKENLLKLARAKKEQLKTQQAPMNPALNPQIAMAGVNNPQALQQQQLQQNNNMPLAQMQALSNGVQFFPGVQATPPSVSPPAMAPVGMQQALPTSFNNGAQFFSGLQSTPAMAPIGAVQAPVGNLNVASMMSPSPLQMPPIAMPQMPAFGLKMPVVA